VCVGKDISVDELRQLYSLVGACYVGQHTTAWATCVLLWPALQPVPKSSAGRSLTNYTRYGPLCSYAGADVAHGVCTDITALM
jgi:hypothetical protein